MTDPQGEQLRVLQDRTRQLEGLLAQTPPKHRGPTRDTAPAATSLASLACHIESNSDELRALIAAEHSAIEDRLRDLDFEQTKVLVEALPSRIATLEAKNIDTTQLRALSAQVDALCSNQKREIQARGDADSGLQAALLDHQREWQSRERALMDRVEGTLRSYRVELSGHATQQQWAADDAERARTYSVEGGAPPADEVVVTLQAELRRRSEETEVLRMAVMNDRLHRENAAAESQMQHRAVQLQLDAMRKGQDDLREELEKQRAESRRLLDNLEECTKLQDLYASVVGDLRRVKGEQRVVLQGLDTLTKYVEVETRERRDEQGLVRASLDHLGNAVQEAGRGREERSRPAAPAVRRVATTTVAVSDYYVDPRVLSGAHGADLVSPELADEFHPNQAMMYHERRSRLNKIVTPFGFYLLNSSPGKSSPHRGGALPPSESIGSVYRSNAVGVMTADTVEIPVAVKATGNALLMALVDFYGIHNPSKMSTVPSIIKEYDGAPHELTEALEAQYDAFGYFASCEMMMGPMGMRHDEVLPVLQQHKGKYSILLKQVRSHCQSGVGHASPFPHLPSVGPTSPPGMSLYRQQGLQSDMASIRQNATTLLSHLDASKPF